jgi:iron complex outermembrane receptor protein
MRRILTRAAGHRRHHAVLAAAAAFGSAAGAVETSPERLRELTLEELGEIEVTTVMKRPQSLAEAPAAVYVITRDDIRRSGATSLPEALRLAPNLIVARRSANDYAISARGFNSFEAANKLLVLIDGRSVYTALHGGVFWDQEHVPLIDIERIEVMSGAGGTLWGANAFNGVINIVTRAAAETDGGALFAFAGVPDQGGIGRIGAARGDVAFRITASGRRSGPTLDSTGAERDDEWRGWQTGARIDLSPGDWRLSAQGAYYENDIGGGAEISGKYFVLSADHPIGGRASAGVLAYYDGVDRSSAFVEDKFEAYNIEAKAVAAFGRHTAVAGAGYRFTDDHFEIVPGGNPFFLSPVSDDISIAHVFLQDEIAVSDRLALSLGLKYEYSSFSGGEWLPNAQLSWKPDEATLLWASVARAVRTASRVDRDVVAPGILERAADFNSEEVMAYEAGMRRMMGRASLSISLYFNDYDDLRILALQPNGLLRLANRMHGLGYGAEIWGDYQLTDWWRLRAGLNVLHKDLELEPPALPLALDQHQGNDPDFQASVRSMMTLHPGVELDLYLRAVDDLENPAIPGYVEADARLGWALDERTEIALVGRNLLDNAHPETGRPDQRGEVRRSAHAELRLRF